MRGHGQEGGTRETGGGSHRQEASVALSQERAVSHDTHSKADKIHYLVEILTLKKLQY